jgi:glycosyltransferase involved in cell wall biosynthesis
MNDLPRITIVMPSFNQSRFIEESIQSILDQYYPNLEFMILDGGSTDGSTEIIKSYTNHLSYWHSRRDSGQADALIQGFSRATGELIGWLNSDDILLPGALKQIAKTYQSHSEGGIFTGNILLIDEHGRIIRCKRLPSSAAWFVLNGSFSITQPGSFFTRKDYEAVGGLHSGLHYVMDADLFMRMIHNHTPYVKVEAWVAGFRYQPLSKTVLHSPEFELEHEYVRKEFFPWVKTRRIAGFLYKTYQFVNGNYARMFFETIFARGRHWQNWSRSLL